MNCHHLIKKLRKDVVILNYWKKCVIYIAKNIKRGNNKISYYDV